jgi:hypothetical protein
LILDRDAYGILNMGADTLLMFNLGTGDVILLDEKKQMAACPAWRLGVRESGTIRWLIDVGGDPHSR